MTRKQLRQENRPSSHSSTEKRALLETRVDRKPHGANGRNFARHNNAAMSTGPTAGWRPFHIFSIGLPRTPDLSDSGTFVPAQRPNPDRILNYQYDLFKYTADLCIHAAEKYWCCQFGTTLPNSSPLQPSTSPLDQHFRTHDNDYNTSTHEQSYRDEQNVTLMEYVQRINYVLLERAKAVNNDSDAAIMEAMMRTMKLLTWAEQVQSLAERGGYGMSDDDIVAAVTGARDLICWLLDGEGEVEFNDLWQGKWVYGGVVMSEEDLDACGI